MGMPLREIEPDGLGPPCYDHVVPRMPRVTAQSRKDRDAHATASPFLRQHCNTIEPISM
jgi:hypothetical protein